MLEFAKQHLPENTGLVYVKNDKVTYVVNAPIRTDALKWNSGELFKLTRLGTMRIYNLKKNINKLKYNNNP